MRLREGTFPAVACAMAALLAGAVARGDVKPTVTQGPKPTVTVVPKPTVTVVPTVSPVLLQTRLRWQEFIVGPPAPSVSPACGPPSRR